MDLIRLTLLQVKVTDDRQGRKSGSLRRGKGDVALIDRGYKPARQSLVPAIDRGVDVVLRYNPHSMSLYHPGRGGGHRPAPGGLVGPRESAG